MKKQIWKRLPVILFILISGGCYSCGQRQYTEIPPLVQESEAILTTESPVAAEGLSAAETAAAVCYVYVCGAVHHAGVYEVPEGERIYRVLELAGGYTEEAAKEYLNLAAPVTDGMKLFVPTEAELETLEGAGFFLQMFEETSVEPQSPAGSRTIDLNKASKEELMTLTGIGEAKADAIIKYRQESGRFNRIEDIMNISGIKQAAFDKIKDNVTVGN